MVARAWLRRANLPFGVVVAPAYVLFFLMLFLPTAYRPVKAALIVLVLVAIVGNAVRSGGGLRLHPTVLAWTGLYLVLGVVFTVVGLVHHAPGALRMMSVYLLWPVLYTVFVAGAADRRILAGLRTVLVAAAVVVPLYSLLFVFERAGIWPSQLFVLFPQDARVNFDFYGAVQFWLDSVASVLFLAPFAIAAFTIYGSRPGSKRRWALWLGIALSIPVALLALRRALILVVALAPLLTFALLLLLARPGLGTYLKRLSLAVGIALIMVFAGIGISHGLVRTWTPARVAQEVAAGYNFAGPNLGASSRRDQFVALIAAWRQHPLFGAGHGAVVPNLVRPPDVLEGIRTGNTYPWSYELWYVGLLFQTGLIGFVLYSSGVVWIFLSGLRMIRSGHPLGLELFPVLIGSASFLIANATNPYLAKYDYLWVIFLPVAYVNLWLVERRSQAALEPGPLTFSATRASVQRQTPAPTLPERAGATGPPG